MHDLTGCPKQAECVLRSLRQRLASEHFTPHVFRIGVAISMALMGLHLHEIMDLVGRKEVT